MNDQFRDFVKFMIVLTSLNVKQKKSEVDGQK